MARAMPQPTADDLRALAEKYRALAELRAHRDLSPAADPRAPGSRAALRTLAERHPGCLRELDTLGAAAIEQRAAAAAAAADGGALETWMAWIWAYHRLMRASLAVKRLLGRGRLREGAPLAALLAEAERVAGWPLDASFVRAVADPPQRRLGVVVLNLLGELYGDAPSAIGDVLFPKRRPSPYVLR
jgi:hypothetical protein